MGGFERRDGLDVDVAFHAFRCVGAGVACRALEAGIGSVGRRPRLSSCVHAVFLSYASSLVVPRVGEVLRCGVLKKYDGTSFTKSLGTVVDGAHGGFPA